MLLFFALVLVPLVWLETKSVCLEASIDKGALLDLNVGELAFDNFHCLFLKKNNKNRIGREWRI